MEGSGLCCIREEITFDPASSLSHRQPSQVLCGSKPQASSLMPNFCVLGTIDPHPFHAITPTTIKDIGWVAFSIGDEGINYNQDIYRMSDMVMTATATQKPTKLLVCPVPISANLIQIHRWHCVTAWNLLDSGRPWMNERMAASATNHSRVSFFLPFFLYFFGRRIAVARI